MTQLKSFLLATIILSSTFGTLAAQEWLTNYDLAIEQSKEQSKPILLVFQGSDWCGPCIKLEKTIWSSTTFESFASEELILLKADFPRRKKNALTPELQEQNNLLAEKYNHKGIFPLVVILNDQGKIIHETGYKKISAKEYVEQLKSIL